MANVNKYLKTRFENQTDISTKKLISLLFTNPKTKNKVSFNRKVTCPGWFNIHIEENKLQTY